jgi:peptide/nickel transport system permease protein
MTSGASEVFVNSELATRPQTPGGRRRGLRAALRDTPWSARLSGALLILVAAWAIAPGLFTDQDPLKGNHLDKFQSPSLVHWFGTDHLGRDVLTRVIHGTSQTLLTAGLAVAVGLVVGSIIGILAGVSGPVVDAVGMRISDVLLALPAFLISIWIVTAYGPGPLSVGIGVGIGSIAIFARVFRSEVLRVRALDYVEAAFLSGETRWSVIRRHIVPNAGGTVVALAVIDLSAAILAISALGYLGYSAPPPTPEWGLLVAEGRNYLANAWWLTSLPGIIIVAVIVALGVVSRRLLKSNHI